MTELTGSFLMAAIVSAVLCLIILVAGGRRLDASVDTWTFFTWLTISSTAGAWLMLGLAKFWEGHEGDDILRRFVMMVAGLADRRGGLRGVRHADDPLVDQRDVQRARSARATSFPEASMPATGRPD